MGDELKKKWEMEKSLVGDGRWAIKWWEMGDEVPGALPPRIGSLMTEWWMETLTRTGSDENVINS